MCVHLTKRSETSGTKVFKLRFFGIVYLCTQKKKKKKKKT